MLIQVRKALVSTLQTLQNGLKTALLLLKDQKPTLLIMCDEEEDFRKFQEKLKDFS